MTGFAEPSILQGVEAKMSIIDWRSWKPDRPAKRTDSTESQRFYEAEDRGWRVWLIAVLVEVAAIQKALRDDGKC